jgi:hypothetical protein
LFFHPFDLLLVRIACVFHIFQEIWGCDSAGVEGLRPFLDMTLCTLKMVIHVSKDPCVFIFRFKQPTNTLLRLMMQTKLPFETRVTTYQTTRLQFQNTWISRETNFSTHTV